MQDIILKIKVHNMQEGISSMLFCKYGRNMMPTKEKKEKKKKSNK
jgi:hypothetical protein